MDPFFSRSLFAQTPDQPRRSIREQLYLAIKAAITDGRLPSEAKLPSTRELAASLSLGRNTVSYAYEQLLAEGYLRTQQGAGSFVANLETEPLGKLSSSTSKTKKQTRQPQPSPDIDDSDPAYPTLRPLISGSPDLALFPREEWIRIYNRFVRRSQYSFLHYGHGAGYKPLRNAIAAHLNSFRGIDCDSDQIVILSGSQQGLDLCAQTLCKSGDSAIIENPSYSGIRNVLTQRGIRTVPINVDEHGLDVRQAIRTASNARMAIVTPSHQFPIGTTLSVSRRLELIRWAVESNAWILEDDYDSEYRYAGQPIQAMRGIDTTGKVIYLGTFSKSLFPDIRIGYLALPSELVETFTQARSTHSGAPPIALQATLATFIETGRFHKHLRRTRKVYQGRRDFLVDQIEKHCGETLEIGPKDSGMHLTVFLKTAQSDQSISEAAANLGYHFPPLSHYTSTPLKRGGFVIGFSSYSNQQIETAIRALSKTINAQIDKR